MVGSELEIIITELRLGPPGGSKTKTTVSRETDSERDDRKNERKRVFSETETTETEEQSCRKGSHKSTAVAVAVAVGWPPVCSYRKRSIGSDQKECTHCMEMEGEAHAGYSKRLVKISKDGVPFLRKIDVSDFNDYFHLLAAIQNLFACPTLGEAMKDAENAEYVPIYEDKDGDWLLIGDVPWNYFDFRRLCKRKSPLSTHNSSTQIRKPHSPTGRQVDHLCRWPPAALQAARRPLTSSPIHSPNL